ncbi:hypothetical protein [Morganella psychrotolerans]|uniref:Uncharacterized protein n=1 Tax=Morganella psychrotolerans TaxID=368603 RepID=A0A1B8HR53_9GAMM|nr:hypothetical protein [Morganella psychrotolerans]OBU11865.1 hypothetical protein AYY18_18035 [Morganella psychrotolerans]
MKKIKFLLSVLLGIGGTLAYQWVYPPFGNPYYFLSPKITIGEPIDIPIKLYEKGYEVDFVFWNTPLPAGRMFFITPLQSPSPHVILKLSKNKDVTDTDIFYPSDLFAKNGILGDINDEPIFNVELYRINSDLTESMISSRIITKNSPGGVDSLSPLTSNKSDYGQYRIKVKVMGDWPQLKIDGLSYFVSIDTYFNK